MPPFPPFPHDSAREQTPVPVSRALVLVLAFLMLCLLVAVLLAFLAPPSASL
jgi:hypothetical protein